MKLGFKNELKNVLVGSVKHLIFETDPNKVVVILNYKNDISGPLKEFSMSMSKNIKNIITSRSIKMAPVIIVSELCREITDLKKQFKKCMEAFDYCIFYGDTDVYFVRDINLICDSNIDYFDVIKEKLCQYIKTVDKKASENLIDEFVNYCIKNKHRISHTAVQQKTIYLFDTALKIPALLGINILNDESENFLSFYSRAFKARNLKEISKIFKEYINLVIELIQSSRDKKENVYISKIKDYMSEHMAEDLSLETVAEQVSLNPIYLSRLFKKLLGKNFTDYLNTLRITKAYELLCDVNLKVNEVGRMTGYNNTNYFIKVFKEHFGITPGEFKGIHSK
jgi:two-component system response regulator YesN